MMGGEGLIVSGTGSGASLEELNQKKAQIAALEAQLASALQSQKELETKSQQPLKNLSVAENKIKELETRLTQAAAAGGGDNNLKNELSSVAKERDDLRDRLKEFEIIADDLANLKRLQQENEQLKRSLAAQGGAVPESVAEVQMPFAKTEVAEVFEELGLSASAEETPKELEELLAPPVVEAAMIPDSDSEPAPIPMAAAPDQEGTPADNKPKSEKTPEDLLSEFEKMLG
jgi:chromosome segregation ATPase